MPRPVIVYVTPKPPYPLTNGMAIRQFHLLQAYAKWGHVRLVTFYKDEAQRDAAHHLATHCERVHVVSTRTMVGESFQSVSRSRVIARRLRGYRPNVITWSHSPEMTSVVEDLAADADVVHVARLHMASQTERLLAERSRRQRMVLDLDDVETSSRFREHRYGPRMPLLHRLFGYYDLARLWAYQASAIRHFDRVFVCSERDRQRFARSNVVVVPNGTRVPAALPSHRTDNRTIMFCGLLSYGPNVDAVHFLVKSVFPEIRRAVPDARLVIVGRAPGPEIRALHDGKTVVVAADVPSVTEYYASATIAVVPLRFGGGTRIKILEAWAHGVPVVSTTIGCEGIDGVHARHLMVADMPQDFAGRCVALLQSADLRRRLAWEGWRLVSERYRWDNIGMRAVAQVAEMLQGPISAGEASTNQTAGSDDRARQRS
jgi:glycosyltransferase involved in cell wall biosynthesis